MGTVNKDRIQHLEEMGRACREAWQGRMAVVQAIPDMPLAMLQDALPTYRSWLGALAAMNQGWLGVAGSGAQLLDPMLPWHWLGMGLQVKEVAESAAGESLRSSANAISAAHSQPMSQPRSRVMQESPVHRPTFWEQKENSFPAAESFPFPEVHSPSLNRPHSGKAIAEKQGQHGKIPTPQHPSTEKGALSQNELSQNTSSKNELSQNPFPEERKQIIFRGLDQFAAFVQQPVAADKGQEQGRQSFAHESWEDLGHDSESWEQKSKTLPMTEEGTWGDHPHPEDQKKGAISGIDLQEDFRSESEFPQSAFAPQHISKFTPDMARLSAWDQVHAQWEQLTEVPRLTAMPPKIAPSRQVGLHHHSVPQPEKILASQRFATPTAKEANAQGPQQLRSNSVQSAAHNTSAIYMPWMETPQPIGANLDESFKVEALMEALTEQLQRDFKRYYGG